MPVRLPALRERMGDLESLVDALCDDISHRSGLPHKSLTPDALELLAAQTWPGNIRELRNVLEQASLMTDDPVLTPAHFRPAGLDFGRPAAHAADAHEHLPVSTPAAAVGEARTAAAPIAAATIVPLPQAVAQLELSAIRAALEATGGNKLAASRLLGISRATLYEKLPLLAR